MAQVPQGESVEAVTSAMARLAIFDKKLRNPFCLSCNFMQK